MKLKKQLLFKSGRTKNDCIFSDECLSKAVDISQEKIPLFALGDGKKVIGFVNNIIFDNGKVLGDVNIFGEETTRILDGMITRLTFVGTRKFKEDNSYFLNDAEILDCIIFPKEQDGLNI